MTKMTKMQIKRDATLPGGRVWGLKIQKYSLRYFSKRASDTYSRMLLRNSFQYLTLEK